MNKLGGIYSVPKVNLNKPIYIEPERANKAPSTTGGSKQKTLGTTYTATTKNKKSLELTAAELATAATAKFENTSRTAQAKFGKNNTGV